MEFPTLADNPWLWWRSQMPVTQKWAYLDHAAVGPLSRPAADAMRRYATQAEEQGDAVWPDWHAAGETLRKGFAELLSSKPENICFVPNTSTGINLVAEGFPWRPGDNVVIPAGEFPSNLFPWQNQAERGVEVRVVPTVDGCVELDELFRRVDQSTRIIAASWVGYATGFRLDLAELVRRAHEQGVLVFLDAIQGLGVHDLNLENIDVDFLAADGHKWLLGPEGLGIAMIQSRHLETLRCTNVGWNSARDTYNFSHPKMELRTNAARFEPGSANMAGFAALGGSLELILQIRREHGPDAIQNRILMLAESLCEKLESIGIQPARPNSSPTSAGGLGQTDQYSGIVAFAVPGCSPAKVREHAIQAGCVTSCRGVGVRVGIHAYNNETDLNCLVESVKESMAKESEPGG